MAKITGGCRCGAVRCTAEANPTSATVRHCRDCQHLAGSAFSIAIAVPDRAFRPTKGEPRPLQRVADSGRTVTRWLCPECGCWIAGGPQPGATPGEMIRRVRAGTLDDTSRLQPTAHFWTRSKQPWVVLPEGDQILETQPG